MSLPVLDKENFQHTSSDWVVRAGAALRAAGFLHADPTGLFDDEFAAAVGAFQEHHGIHEDGAVGPLTWAALGVQEDYTVGQHSDDGLWQWDGTDWVAAAEPTTEHPAGQLSEDGQWRWDGAQWVTAAVAAAPAGPADFEDTDLADAIVRYELGILRQWKAALDSFNEVMESETSKSAQPEFATALAKVFGEKVLGDFAKAAKAELVVSLLKGLVGEAGRAQNASKSVAFRDFYTGHVTHIANVDKELEMQKAPFVAGVRREADQLLHRDPDSYGMLRMELMELYQDVEHRYRTATQEALFEELSAEWTRLSVNHFAWHAEEASEIRVQLKDSDLSVIGVTIEAPDGDKLVDQLTRQPGGMHVWTMKAPKLFIFTDERENAIGYVRVDAANRLANLPAEQDSHYRRRYERLAAHGGPAPITKN